MLEGIVIEDSLDDKTILSSLEILRSWTDGSWKLHRVRLRRERALELAEHLVEGPWYIHFWVPGTDNVLVIFKHNTFDIKYSDKSTWESAVNYGVSTGIPVEQLDFLIN